MFFRDDEGVMAVPIAAAGDSISVGRASRALKGIFRGGTAGMTVGNNTMADYDVSRDGTHFVMFPVDAKTAGKTDDKDALKAALIERRAKLSGAEAVIEHLQLVIAKMKREMFGPRSERSQRLIDQLELQLEELAAAAGEDEAKAEPARIPVQGFTRRPATRRNFPADLPRRRIVHPAPTSCPCCGGSKLSKIGEDVT